MKYRKAGFTFIELIAALFICSLIFAFFLPNMLLQYSNVSKAEKELEMKEILYEEVSNHYKDKTFETRRGDYLISVTENKVEIIDEVTKESIKYD